MAKVVSTQIRMDNLNYFTYVLKKFDNGTYVLKTMRKVNGCYFLIKTDRGVCV